jgi:hypothetical protein
VDDLFELKSRYGVPMLSQFAEVSSWHEYEGWMLSANLHMQSTSISVCRLVKFCMLYLEN